MLYRAGTPFSIGKSRYANSLPGSVEGETKIYVKVEPDALGFPVLAQLDTGAPWTVLSPEVARECNLGPTEGPGLRLNTRFGSIPGHLHRTTLKILADEGSPLEIDATIFVPDHWPTSQNFLGYGGALERMRFAVDPTENLFYFGQA